MLDQLVAKARGLQEEVGGAELRMESWRLHQQLAEVVGKRDVWREKEKETPQVRWAVGEGRRGERRGEEGRGRGGREEECLPLPLPFPPFLLREGEGGGEGRLREGRRGRWRSKEGRYRMGGEQ